MKTTLQATLVAICALGMAAAQAQSGLGPNYIVLPEGTDISKLPTDVQSAVKTGADGRLYVDKTQAHGITLDQGVSSSTFESENGVAAGSIGAAGTAAAGSTAIIIAVGVGMFAVIGAVVGGSASNTTTTSTATSTHK